MSEMVDRVRRAMNEALNIYGASDEAARKVIEAMREPTEAMAKVAFEIEDERYAAHSPQEDRCFTDCWRAAIDDALKEDA